MCVHQETNIKLHHTVRLVKLKSLKGGNKAALAFSDQVNYA